MESAQLGCEQFVQPPNVVGYTRLHRWRHSQAGVYLAEVVIGEVKRVGVFQVHPLFREGVSQRRAINYYGSSNTL